MPISTTSVNSLVNNSGSTAPTKLDHALTWAARGFRVFPLIENGKEPLFKGWTESATCDPTRIREWWTCPISGSEFDYNIGCCTSGLIVADLDVKAGKRGLESFESLGLKMSSLCVSTPSGGVHVYYDGPDRANAQELLGPGSGLDVRSWHGFVVAPGSTVSGVPYTVLHDAEMEMAPDEIYTLLKPPRERGRQVGEMADDSPSVIAQGAHYLEHVAKIAIEGQGGNATTYGVCAVLVRDFGLSEDAALTLLLGHWNERCVPPWSVDELVPGIMD